MEFNEARCGSPAWDEFISALSQSFPSAELVETSFLERGLSHGARLTAAMFGDMPQGFAYWVETDDIVYLTYLVVAGRLRSHGIGTRLLGYLKGHAGTKPVIAEVETCDPRSDNALQRVRRQAFYARCGFNHTPWCSEQEGVVFDILATAEGFEPHMLADALMQAFDNIWTLRVLPR